MNTRVCQAEVRDGKQLVLARVVYEWLSYQPSLPDQLLDADLVHTFSAVRNRECDRPVGFDEVMAVRSGRTAREDSQALPCYVIGPNGYHNSYSAEGKRVHPGLGL